MNINKIKNVDDSDIKSFHGKVDLSKQGPLMLNETNLQIMYAIKKQSVSNKIPLSELARYLNISFTQVVQDWHDFKQKDMHKKSYAARECTISDFGDDDHSEIRFKTW